MDSNFVLELKGIEKHFGGVTALSGVSFQLKAGEVHAVMGENGAGKSTLIKAITGVHSPDAGSIVYQGEEVKFHSSLEAAEAGISAVYQHATAFPTLSVTENIFMGQEITTKGGLYKWKEMRNKAKELLGPLNDQIDVNAPMHALSVAEQQMVEIAKALSRQLKVLILDEPTASLTQKECEELYAIVDHLKERGVSVVIISHRMEDMYRLASRVTVLRDAHYIGTWDVNEISEDELIAHMVGRALAQRYPERTAKIGEVMLEMQNVSCTGVFKDVSLMVRKGEVVCLTGLVGAGRTEICESIFGIRKPSAGKILLEGEELHVRSPKEAFKKGIGLLPEDRQLEGLVYELPIYQNVTSANLSEYSSAVGFLNVGKEKEQSEALCARTALKAASIEARPDSLSGGNQQKVVFSKLIGCDLKLLILDEPTKGVDVGAKYSICEIVNELAEKGYAILLVSSEMPEVLGMSDRIYVVKEGRISGEFETKHADQEILMRAAI